MSCGMQKGFLRHVCCLALAGEYRDPGTVDAPSLQNHHRITSELCGPTARQPHNRSIVLTLVQIPPPLMHLPLLHNAPARRSRRRTIIPCHTVTDTIERRVRNRLPRSCLIDSHGRRVVDPAVGLLVAELQGHFFGIAFTDAVSGVHDGISGAPGPEIVVGPQGGGAVVFGGVEVLQGEGRFDQPEDIVEGVVVLFVCDDGQKGPMRVKGLDVRFPSRHRLLG